MATTLTSGKSIFGSNSLFSAWAAVIPPMMVSTASMITIGILFRDKRVKKLMRIPHFKGQARFEKYLPGFRHIGRLEVCSPPGIRTDIVKFATKLRGQARSFVLAPSPVLYPVGKDTARSCR